MTNSQRRRSLWTAALGAMTLGAIVTAGFLLWRPLASRYVTSRALRDASGAIPTHDEEEERQVEKLVEAWGRWFREGYFNRRVILAAIPRDGFTRDAWPPFLVLRSYFEANSEKLEDSAESLDAFLTEEITNWLDIALPHPKSREFLVNLLIRDFSGLDTWSPPKATGFLAITFSKQLIELLMKRQIACFLLARIEREKLFEDIVDVDKEHREAQRFLVDLMTADHWDSIRRDLDHSTPEVRAGALVMLLMHADDEMVLAAAGEAIGDPSEIVRYAAAGILALRGRDRRGYPQLLGGLFLDKRYEIRWWCGVGLLALGTFVDVLPVAIASDLDQPDSVIRESFERTVDHESIQSAIAAIERLWRVYSDLERALRFGGWGKSR